MKIYLDLLPQERKDELKRKKTFSAILSREMLFLFPVIVFIVILANIYLVLGIQKDNTATAGNGLQSQGDYKQLHEYEDKFKQTNDLATFLSHAASQHIHWSRLISKISDIAGDEIYLSELSTKDYQVFLLGKAKSRESLISFKDAIANSGCADSVNVPLSNLVNPSDVDFQMDFMIKQECLKDSAK
jgi:hypothetical protein